jgi:hypothetical protein
LCVYPRGAGDNLGASPRFVRVLTFHLYFMKVTTACKIYDKPQFIRNQRPVACGKT